MSQLLETLMLVCFGFSWPMSVYKNIKAGTAKSMSLPFILLIVGGLSAKLISHNYSYVLIVYVLNLAIVSTNIVVYFSNLKRDKEAELTTVIVEEEVQVCAMQAAN